MGVSIPSKILSLLLVYFVLYTCNAQINQNAGNNQHANNVQPPLPAHHEQVENQGAQPIQQQQFNQQQVRQESSDDEKHLVDYEQCKEDIFKHCNRVGLDLKSDLAILECLQDKKLSETELLSAPCEHLVWQFKVNITQDDRFRLASKRFCSSEIAANQEMAKCAEKREPGTSLSCFIDFILTIPKESQCFQFLDRTARLAFSDFRVVGPFVAKCRSAIERLQCGTLTPPSAHNKVRVPHTQGHTLECLISKLVKAQEADPTAPPIVEDECRHEIMRIAELQSEDFHLDRQLFFACREDREKFCKEVPSGQGKVFECLLAHRTDVLMEPLCSKLLAERAALMGQNYRMSHPLLDGCADELKTYKCTPSQQFNGAPNFHLNWVLLCLENAARANKDKFSDKCQHELVEHRRLMMSEFRLSPEVVLTCGREIDSFCSPKGDIETQGRTLHCLMRHAQERDPTRQLGSQCIQALQILLKVADIGSNYKVDQVLYASCRKLIDGACSMDAHSEASTLTCLMRHMDDDMPPECEQRLIEVQYFMARDWSLDPELYQACHEDAVSKCSANPNWHDQKNAVIGPDPGPVVLACLYRSAYDEKNPLKKECAANVRRVLRTRAIRVNLMPQIESACRDALSEYCSSQVKPKQEMQCLQEHFEEAMFKNKYKECSAAVYDFTKMMAKDTELNQALTKSCKPVIVNYCQQYANQEIDHGDVLECLLANKDRPEMTSKCRSYVNHFELVTMRDYHFSYRFKQACANDIKKYCTESSNSKAEVIRCLSTVMFEHKVLGAAEDLDKDCKKQLKTAYLQQEQFDDQSHMEEVDPHLMQKCSAELDRLRCRTEKKFEDVVECLRENFDALGPDCKAMVFSREKIEAIDNSFDDELQSHCRADIDRYCHHQEGTKVLDCLQNIKIVRLLSSPCQKVVLERMKEQVKDVRLNVGLLEACREELEKYCPYDYKKINNPQFEKKALLEGVFVTCLRTQYADPRTSVHLRSRCKDEVSKVILESEFDVQLDPLLYKACKATIRKHCGDSLISHSGTFESVLECLKSDFKHGVIKDAECAGQISRRLQESLVDIHLDPILHEACATDIRRVCPDVPMGQSRLIICLLDAMRSKSGKLSTTCEEKLTERNSLWNKAHQENAMLLPTSFAEMIDLVAQQPHRFSLFTWFGVFVMILFCVGCCFGRATKRLKRELKNR